MGKKKKSGRGHKKADIEEVERSPFWPLSAAILLCVVAVFLLLGGFGTGGPLPKGLFHGAYWALGWAAYLLPAALVYWGAYKFRSEDHRIPLGKLLSIFGVLLFTAGWLFTAFASKHATGAWSGSHGGQIGLLLGAAVRQALDATKRLGGSNYVLWGGREGYETLLNTNLGKELDQLGRFLTLVVEHKL